MSRNSCLWYQLYFQIRFKGLLFITMLASVQLVRKLFGDSNLACLSLSLFSLVKVLKFTLMFFGYSPNFEIEGSLTRIVGWFFYHCLFLLIVIVAGFNSIWRAEEIPRFTSNVLIWHYILWSSMEVMTCVSEGTCVSFPTSFPTSFPGILQIISR